MNERDIRVVACFSKQDTQLVRRIVASAALTRSLAAATAAPPPPFTGGACTPWTGGSRGDEEGRKRKIPNSENLTPQKACSIKSQKRANIEFHQDPRAKTQTTKRTASSGNSSPFLLSVTVLRTNSFMCKALSIKNKIPFSVSFFAADLRPLWAQVWGQALGLWAFGTHHRKFGNSKNSAFLLNDALSLLPTAPN